MLRTLLMLAATALPAAAPPAPAWQCRNPDFEASCSDGRCSANSDAFTPMDIGFDEDGHVSACAYSGCWAGRGQPGGDARFFTLVARDLVFEPVLEDPPRRGDLALVLDREQGTAVLTMAPFAQPLVCRRHPRD